ncbi:hypothetical protein DSO57_1028959 [Entomophthora muscae]|uniref:Uncharacterized protein n=1 Tax=Entomophthora muscae TaxID=34485 RepID=A0ACC2S3U9_9FUNG|nr:hypothetical protein DSO57_1028959 [Entomophthora muscae]
MVNQHFLLNSGLKIPALGLGTWQIPKSLVGDLVLKALSIGYRHIDCAMDYENEAEIGEALQKSNVPREDIFITSKLWNTDHEPSLVRKACEKTLKDLKISYLDLYLIHFPFPEPNPDKTDQEPPLKFSLIDTWKALEKLVELGMVKNIGVSNYTICRIQDILDSSPKIKPAVNQVELHPYLPQNELVEYCKEQNIHVTAYSPLGSSRNSPVLLQDPVISEISSRIQKSPAQILLSWGISRGTSVISRTTNPSRLLENITSFELSASDKALVDKITTRVRFNDYYDVYNY